MEWNERLQMLRKQAGFSQEKLAEVCGVSRQAVSKWEAGQSQPDLEKLRVLSRLFNVSLDELVEGTKPFQEPEYRFGLPAYHYEYKSKRTLFGLPLVHVNVGWGKPYVAKGIFALGGIAIGVVSLGGIALGGVCFGALALGVIAFAGLAAGLFAFGGLALGGIALGGFALGWLAFGGAAIGKYAIGGMAMASDIAVGGLAQAHLTIVIQDSGTKILTVGGHSTVLRDAEQARALISQAYPHLWKPLLRVLTVFVQAGGNHVHL